MQGFTTLNYFGLVADFMGIMGALFALFAWREARQIKQAQKAEAARQNKSVQVVLMHKENEDQKIELPVELRRAELSRAEILGRIGMIPMKVKQERFSLTYLNTSKFLMRINEIAAGAADDILIIPCTTKEFEQFNLSS